MFISKAQRIELSKTLKNDEISKYEDELRKYIGDRLKSHINGNKTTVLIKYTSTIDGVDIFNVLNSIIDELLRLEYSLRFYCHYELDDTEKQIPLTRDNIKDKIGHYYEVFMVISWE